jgi:putative hemolysin
MIVNLFFAVVIGLYFFNLLRNQQSNKVTIEKESKKEIEKLRMMREISLTEPLSEKTRPSTFDEVMEAVINEKYTRLPVYEESIDDIVGILHVKDLFYFMEAKEGKPFELRKIIRHPFFVPESRKTDDLFKDMKRTKNHMAVVIDEYGGTSGIVTIEDLLEEIVGNIFDEHDEEEKQVEKIDENTYYFEGIVSLDTVKEVLNIDLPVDEYETLGGFLTGQLGRIPDEGEKPEIEFNGILFKVEEVDDRRIERVKACRT